MNNPESETSTAPSQRFKPIPLENLTAEQRVLADAIRSSPRGAAIRVRSSLPPKLNELTNFPKTQSG